MSGASARLNPLIWLGLPALAALSATLIFAAPFQAFGLQLPEPVFPLPILFAWALIRPSILAPFLVVLMGTALDLLWGGPQGLWAASLLGTFAVVGAGRSMLIGQNGPILWAWYGVACAGTFAIGYVLSMLAALSQPDLFAIFWQFLATVMLFPVAYWLFERFEDADVRFR